MGLWHWFGYKKKKKKKHPLLKNKNKNIGAGFYLNATKEPWNKYFKMYDYIVEELYALLPQELPLDAAKVSIFGHSMGGLGALVISLRNPDKFKSASAFAPISHPSACKIGQRAFAGYLGEDSKAPWKQYDPTELVQSYKSKDLHLLIDQGDLDAFYKDGTLLPNDFLAAAQANNVSVQFNLQSGYGKSAFLILKKNFFSYVLSPDHGYYFVSTFIDSHLEHHSKYLA